MKIESYEPFHIGSKLRYYVDPNHILAKLYNKFEEMNLSNFILNPDVLSGDKLISPFLTIITNPEEKLTIQLNLSANALNVIGDEPKKVVELFLKLLNQLPGLGFELDSTFSFFEIITSIILNLEDEVIKPQELFENFSIKIPQISKETPELIVSFIRFSDTLVHKEDDNRVIVEIIPNRTSPNKRIILKIQNRTRDYSKLIKFQKKLEDYIELIFKNLVDKKNEM